MTASKVLAIDYGTKNVGTATGSFEVGIAFPNKIVANKSRPFLLGEVKSLCDEYEVDLIVVGWPRNMNDDFESKIMLEVKKFSEDLAKFTGLRVELFDERLSTFEAKELMVGFDGKRVDAQSAQIILQRFFNNFGS